MLIIRSANAPQPPQPFKLKPLLMKRPAPASPEAPIPAVQQPSQVPEIVQEPPAEAPVQQAPVESLPPPPQMEVGWEGRGKKVVPPEMIEPPPPPAPVQEPEVPVEMEEEEEGQVSQEKEVTTEGSESDKAASLIDLLSSDESQYEPDSDLDKLGLQLSATIKRREDSDAEARSLRDQGKDVEAQAKEAEVESLNDQASDLMSRIFDSRIQQTKFKYKATDASGNAVEGEVDGRNKDQAIKNIAAKGLTAVDVQPILEETPLGEFVEQRIDRIKEMARLKGVNEEDISDVSGMDALETLVHNFAVKAYENPGMRNSLTSYILGWLKYIVIENDYYQYMKYITHPEDNFSEEVNRLAAQEGWSQVEKILEQYKRDKWGSADRVRKAVDWWNKTYEKIRKAGLPFEPIRMDDPFDPLVNKSQNLNAFKMMLSVLNSVASNPSPRVKEFAKKIGLVKDAEVFLKNYREKGPFHLEPRMFDPARMNPWERAKYEDESVSGRGYKAEEIGKWNEMYGKILASEPDVAKAHPDAKPLPRKPSPEQVRSLKSLFDDVVANKPSSAEKIGLADRVTKTIKPYLEGGDAYVSQDMIKPERRGVHPTRVMQAIQSAARTGTLTTTEGEQQDYSEKDVQKAMEKMKIHGPSGHPAAQVGPKAPVNPMTTFREIYKPGKGYYGTAVEEGILSTTWGAQRAAIYSNMKRLEDEIRKDMRAAGIPEPKNDEQMKAEMLRNEKSRHLAEQVNMYFDDKPEAARILSELVKKWEPIKPAITGKMPPEVIKSETSRRQAVMALLAREATAEGTLERRVAETIAAMPFEVSSPKPGDPNHEEGLRRTRQNQLTMKKLFEESKGEIMEGMRAESERTGQPFQENEALRRFNSIVKSVMGKMMGALSKPEVEKELADKGLTSKGAWWHGAMMDLRIVRLAVSAALPRPEVDKGNGVVIEYMVDELFPGDDARAFVARMLCKGPPLDQSRIEKVMEASRRMFPKQYEVSRKTSLAPFVLGVKQEIESFLSDPDNVRRMAEDIGLPMGDAAAESMRVAASVRRQKNAK